MLDDLVSNFGESWRSQMSKVDRISFHINPKAFYTAIAYGYLAGLNPRNFVRNGDDIVFDIDRNNSSESRYIDDLLGRNVRRKVLALETIYCRMFPINSKLVDVLSRRLECQQRVAELSPIFEELLARQSKQRDFNSTSNWYGSKLGRSAHVKMRTA